MGLATHTSGGCPGLTSLQGRNDDDTCPYETITERRSWAEVYGIMECAVRRGYVSHRIADAVTEGINAERQWIKATGRGFSKGQRFRAAVLFRCGALKLYPHNV